ncbi:hypothetical protein TrVFT333_004596 [Trichoderma virens FT-333]|nr:hypothetical protein TrVFT333_004596 [Trichoderma virens FT-333]
MHSSTLLTLLATGTTSLAYTIPANLQAIYNAHKAGTCSKPLSGTSSSGAVFCADIPNAIFLKGSNGNYDNMDVDCDGADDKAGDCSNDPTGYGETAFKDTVQTYGISDLNANIHPYVVVNEPPYFDAEHYGLKPLSVMAVVCNNQVWYGIWGDTNTEPTTGEASISLAQLCFPNEGLNGDFGHGTKDVLYIGFLGDNTVPGKTGAKWNAKNVSDFEASIKAMGDRLVQGLGSNNGGGGTNPPLLHALGQATASVLLAALMMTALTTMSALAASVLLTAAVALPLPLLFLHALGRATALVPLVALMMTALMIMSARVF